MVLELPKLHLRAPSSSLWEKGARSVADSFGETQGLPFGAVPPLRLCLRFGRRLWNCGKRPALTLSSARAGLRGKPPFPKRRQSFDMGRPLFPPACIPQCILPGRRKTAISRLRSAADRRRHGFGRLSRVGERTRAFIGKENECRPQDRKRPGKAFSLCPGFVQCIRLFGSVSRKA